MSDMGKLKDATSGYVSNYPLTFSKDGFKEDPSLPRKYKIAWDTARKAASILKEKYNADKVIVFGSLLDKSRFNKWSDIDLAVWGKLAEVVSKNLGKGRLVAVRGRLQINYYEADDGTKRQSAEVNAEEVRFLDWPKEESEAS